MMSFLFIMSSSSFFSIKLLTRVLIVALLTPACFVNGSDHGESYYFASHVSHNDELNRPVDDIFKPLWPQFELRNLVDNIDIPNLTQEDTPDEQLLTDYLLRNYSSEVRPVDYVNQSLSVVARIYLMKILDLVEKEQVLHMVLRFQLGWHDLSLTWDPKQFGNLTSIILPGDALWIPDVQTGNSANDRYGLLRNRDFPFKVHNDGEIWWHPTGGVFTRCSLNLLWFPFDMQRCPLVLESAMHSQSAVNLTVRPNKPSIILTMYTENSLWDLIDATGTSYYYKSASAASAKIWTPSNQIKHENNFTRVVFWFKLRRKTNYYKWNVLYPCFMLTTMQLLTFLLPLDSLTRVHQATTILLSVIIFQAVIVDELPKSSDSISLISIYTMLMIAVSVVAVVESMLVANLLRRNFGPIKIPVHTAFLLKVFLKSPPLVKDDIFSNNNSGQTTRKGSQVQHANQAAVVPRGNLESVREESEIELESNKATVANDVTAQLSPVDLHLLTVPMSSGKSSPGGSSSNASSRHFFPSPRSSQDEFTQLQAEHIQDHLVSLWRRTTGRPPLKTVVVNWPRIACVINAVAFLTCVVFVVIIPAILMVFVIPSVSA